MARPKRILAEVPADPLRQAKDALYRHHIIDAAEQVFAEQGFEAARMQQIAQQAGISLGTLYGQFEGKQDLYRAVLIARDTEMLDAVREAAAQRISGEPSLAAVLDLMEIHLRFLMDHPAYLKMQLQQGFMWYHSSSRPSPLERDLWEEGMQLMRQVFDWGMAQSIFVDQPADEAMALLLSIQQARLSHWVMAQCSSDKDELLQTLKADFVRFFCTPAIAREWLDKSGHLRKRRG